MKSNRGLQRRARAVISCRASVPDADLYPITNTMRNTSSETTQEQDEALARRDRLSTIHYSRSAEANSERFRERGRFLYRTLGWWNGRHVRLRGVCRKACGFKSRPEHDTRSQRSQFRDQRSVNSAVADQLRFGLSADRSLLPTFLFSQFAKLVDLPDRRFSCLNGKRFTRNFDNQLVGDLETREIGSIRDSRTLTDHHGVRYTLKQRNSC